jgi:GNAT superfamily N-acetyltransferase
MSSAPFFDNQIRWQERLTPPDRVRGFGTLRAGVTGTFAHLMLPDSADETVAHLGAAIDWVRGMAALDAIVWSHTPDPGLDLTLLAGGWRVGFEPWWMVADLRTDAVPADLGSCSPAWPGVVRLGRPDDIAPLLAAAVPYASAPQLEQFARQTDGIHWLVADEDGRAVGQAVVHLDDQGWAGLFNVGVADQYRRRGIGGALTAAAVRMARDGGATMMGLNSTPMAKHVYEDAGFRQVGVGQTWLRSTDRLLADPPEHEQAAVRAIGSGAINGLPADVPQLFWCGLSGQQSAARFGQPEALHALVRRGQVPDLVAMWSLGLTREATAAAGNPRARELVTQPWDARPLHHAAASGNEGLAAMLLGAGADLTARDSQFRGTPLGWAVATGHARIAELIRAAGGQ